MCANCALAEVIDARRKSGKDRSLHLDIILPRAESLKHAICVPAQRVLTSMTVTVGSGGCCGRSIWNRRSVCRNFNDCPPASNCADITFVSRPDISSGDDRQSKTGRKSLPRFGGGRTDFIFCTCPHVLPYI